MLRTLLVLFFFSNLACTEQFNPRPHRKQIRAEQDLANRPVAKLTEEGKLPTGGAVEKKIPIAQVYSTYCASCHGNGGKGDGPAGAALNPKPRNFSDKAWQTATNDDRIKTVLAKGGTAVGLSPMMAAFGAILTAEQIEEMVGHVRSFSK